MSAAEVGLLVVVLTVVQSAIVIALTAYIQRLVGHEFDKRIEVFRYEIRLRERAALIAELIAEWDSQSDNRKRLNQLTLEANLWLPESQARDLNRILRFDPKAKFPKELVIDIRHLLRGEQDDLKPDEITYFPPKET
ncbi:MAG: hypothetical protein ACRD9S_06400 [Pyrinomonadaceae bacterium]